MHIYVVDFGLREVQVGCTVYVDRTFERAGIEFSLVDIEKIDRRLEGTVAEMESSGTESNRFIENTVGEEQFIVTGN